MAVDYLGEEPVKEEKKEEPKKWDLGIEDLEDEKQLDEEEKKKK